MRNDQVLNAWVEGSKARNGRGTLTTDGTLLWSYGLLIGSRFNGRAVVFDYTARGVFGFVSMTTSHHVGKAKRYSA